MDGERKLNRIAIIAMIIVFAFLMVILFMHRSQLPPPSGMLI
jgi:hypothetical protein